MKPKKLTIPVSSPVYGIEELLERIYSYLTAFGYELWLSHKGTVAVNPNESNADNCLKAVSISDLRVIDLYEDAIQNRVDPINRKGNWVQKYTSDKDAQLYAVAQ
jgi:hypothetical protein